MNELTIFTLGCIILSIIINGSYFYVSVYVKHLKDMNKHYLKELKQAEEVKLEALKQLIYYKNKEDNL